MRLPRSVPGFWLADAGGGERPAGLWALSRHCFPVDRRFTRLHADGEQLGKNVGDDLNEGKPTLPLLHAMHHGTPEQAQMIRTAIEQGNGRHLLEPVLEAMNACGSLEWTRQRAEEEADKAIAALQVLPDTPWREALIGLAHIAVQRDR